MKFLIAATAALVGTASAVPSQLERRQATQNDLKSGGGGNCKKVALVFARASTEPGNMGMSMGPAVCSGLKAKFSGQVACQGVGSPYSAGLADNVAPAGTTSAAIGEAIKMLTLAAKCPETIIVGGGYSQGTAVMMNAVSKVDADIRKRIAGVVLFGYTKNAQQKGGIPNYPKEKVKVFCSSGDGVCGGTLAVTPGHFSYMGDGSGPKSIAFLVDAINSAKGGGGSSAGASEGGEPAAEAPAAPKGKGKGKGKGLWENEDATAMELFTASPE